MYICTLCETPTQFSDYHKSDKHFERFHIAYNQKNKGKKRGKDNELGEISPKRLKSNETKILADDVADADTDENNGENNEEGYEDDTDGYEKQQYKLINWMNIK